MADNLKTPPRVMQFSSLEFQPRFAFPEMANVVEVAGVEDGSKLAGGFARFNNARIPWQVKYDELVLVLDGQLSIETERETLQAGQFDTIWLPSGTELTYFAENALVFYSLYPSNWAQQLESRP
ncbi:hypothetical protein WH297_23280 [Ochrobactrum vermis]|uniref:Ethanolamine utilization protein EutQ n=1 Tax=Ochrobactrum vermis TaxID=1827297 RepID=A0ABU8PK51_9HYPH